MALVLVHSQPDLAAENAVLLPERFEQTQSFWYRQPWPRALDVDSVETRAEGRLLLARLRGEDIGRSWYNWVIHLDPLPLHD